MPSLLGIEEDVVEAPRERMTSFRSRCCWLWMSSAHASSSACESGTYLAGLGDCSGALSGSGPTPPESAIECHQSPSPVRSGIAGALPEPPGPEALPCCPIPGCSLAGRAIVRGSRPKSIGPHVGVRALGWADAGAVMRSVCVRVMLLARSLARACRGAVGRGTPPLTAPPNP